MMQSIDIEMVDQWCSFMDEPAGYADPQRLVSCFNNAIGQTAAKRMLGSGRLRARLSSFVADYYAIPAAVGMTDSPTDNAIALSTAPELAQIALRAGAIYWASTLSGIISGAEAAALRKTIGPDLVAFGLANRDLAGPKQDLDQTTGMRERLETDGWSCVAAWCDEMPAPIGKRVRLKLPPNGSIEGKTEPSFLPLGPEIARRCLE